VELGLSWEAMCLGIGCRGNTSGPNREEHTRGQRELHNENLLARYYEDVQIKSDDMGGVCKKMRVKFCTDNLKERRYTWEDIIKVDLKLGYCGEDSSG
jgi:hypothetical protein